MKAVIIPEFGDADTLQIQEIPSPTPKANQLLVNVKAAGVNRTDILQRGGYSPPPPGDSEILGMEVSGVVEAIGENVEGFEKGDSVFGLLGGGGYAEQCLLDYRLAMHIPDHWDYTTAAAIPEAFFTANENLFTLGKLTAGESVLIHAGGSGIGTISIQMAHLMGATVFTTAGSQRKIQNCLKLGANAGINYKTQDFVEEVKQLTRGLGVHLIQDFVGAAYLSRNLQILQHQGRLVLVGLLGGEKAEVNLGTLMSKRLQIFGSLMRSLPLMDKIAIKERFTKHWLPRLLAGQIRPIIDRIFPIHQASEAHRYMESSQHFGKIILSIQ